MSRPAKGRPAKDGAAKDYHAGERDKMAENRSEHPGNHSRSEPSPAADRSREKVMARALRMLAARPRSERQLRERLSDKPWADPAAIDECIARLKELGYINDGLLARSYASYRVTAKPVGRSRLARELAGKKLGRETIDKALDSVFDEATENTLIDRAIEKRVRTHGLPADQGAAKRMFAHLSRLGFQYDLIMRKLRALRAEIEEEND